MFSLKQLLISGVFLSIGIFAAFQHIAYASEEPCLTQTPLPASIDIVVPAADVAKEISRFVGMWGDAKWGGNLCHTLVVTAVDSNGKAQIIYSYGKFEPWNINQAEYFEPSGQIIDGVLSLSKFGNGADVTYRFSNGQLLGEYLLDGLVTLISLKKIE